MWAPLLCGQQSKEASVRAYLQRAERSQQQGDFHNARKELQEAVRLNPAEPEAHGRLGIVYRRLGMTAEAIESLKRALELDPNPRVQVLLAYSYMDAVRYRDAAPLLAASFEA